jgi:hypothetical protein
VTYEPRTQDPRLHDRDWLQSHYLRHGDMWIALELGCNRKTVRRQRERLGIQSMPPGRRPGMPPVDAFTPPEVLNDAAERFTDDATTPTYNVLLEHLVAADQARKAHDRARERDAAINGAVTWLRIADRLDQAA